MNTAARKPRGAQGRRSLHGLSREREPWPGSLLSRAGPLLTREEELALARDVRERGCPRARERLICSNLRLVSHVAKRFLGKGPAMADLVAEGTLGLVRAVDRYNPESGARFATYAVWWISQAIRLAVMKEAAPVYITPHMFIRVARCRRLLRSTPGGEGGPAGLDDVLATAGVPARSVGMLRMAMAACTSVRGGTAIPGSAGPSALATQGLEREEDSRCLREAMSLLDQRSAHVLSLRFGMDGRHERTLCEVAADIGTSHERVRQIERCALQKLQARLAEN
ncbi:MAG: sigma-70 family RNA polymerase sigma factor [Phycisphaerales bacterium]